LREARQLALGFRNRNLVKCVFERLVQRKDQLVSSLFAKEKVREQVTAELAEAAGVDRMHVFLDVPTTPSVPYASSRVAFASVRLVQTRGETRVVKSVPLNELPLIGSIAGFMDVLRIYTTTENRRLVERATAEMFKGKSFITKISV
jgi:hypothetical protein